MPPIRLMQRVRSACIPLALAILATSCEDDPTEPLGGPPLTLVDVRLYNANNNECTTAGCTQKPIQLVVEKAGDRLPCCQVAHNANRVRTFSTYVGDTAYVKACRIDGGGGCDQTICRVTNVDPEVGSNVRAELTVVFNLAATTGTVACSGSWENV